MGNVFAVEQLATHQVFALKLIQGAHAINASFVQRFDREIGALRDIRHPNVVQVFDWHLPKSRTDPVPPFLVMELLRGEGLDQLLKRESRVAPGRAVAIMLQVLDALAAAHRVGVLHRDIGPGNVFLVAQPEGMATAKVLDFGLARPTGHGADGSDLTQPGTVLGKPGYVAPEVLVDQTIDERIDVFACGMLLYRMLAGRLPFTQRSSDLLWAERFSERSHSNEYPSPSVHAPDVPPVLDRIVARAIRRQPEERYPSVRLMQESLLAAEAELPDRIEAALPSPSSGLVETRSSPAVAMGTTEFRAGLARRRRRRLGLTAVLTVLTAAGVAVALVIGFGGAAERTPAPGGDSTGVHSIVTLPAATDAAVDRGAAPASEKTVPALDATPGSSAEPIAVAPTDGGGETASGRDVAAPTVRVTFEGLPAGAELRVDGRVVVGSAVYLPTGSAFVPFEVSAAGYAPYAGSFEPSGDRVLRVELTALRAHGPDGGRRPTADGGRPPTAARDGGTLEGRAGATFVTSYGEE